MVGCEGGDGIDGPRERLGLSRQLRCVGARWREGGGVDEAFGPVWWRECCGVLNERG